MPEGGGGPRMPLAVSEAFASALAESILLPGAAVLIGAVAAIFFVAPRHQRRPAPPAVP